MNESEYELPYATVDIPETFYNDLTSAPHSNCLICNRYLLAPGVMYTVEKAIRRHSEFNLTDTITEAAVCMDCMIKMQEYISDESREHLMAHYQELQPMQRAKALLEKEDHDLDHWISECAFTGKDLEDCAEYQISAVFSGNQMLLHFMPMMVSDVAAKDMAEKLSKETKDNMDRFMGEHFGLPPELVNLPLLL
ncbi:MAG: hypothetical protein AAFP02_16280 [Bacteroidota bacterium]